MSTLSTNGFWTRLPWIGRWFHRDAAPSADGDTSRSEQAASPQAGGTGGGAVVSSGERRDRSIKQLQQAYEEVVGCMRSLQDHMEAQSQRSERLLTMMDGLPEALKSLPEHNRNQNQMLQAIQGHLEQQTENTRGLTEAIQGLSQAASHHEQSMTVIQQQLESGEQRQQEMHASFSALSQTLDQMSASSQASTKVLQRLADQGDRSENRVQSLFERNQKQMTMMSCVSWALAILALGVAGWVALGVPRPNASLATAPPAAASPADQPTPAAAHTANAPPHALVGSSQQFGVNAPDAAPTDPADPEAAEPRTEAPARSAASVPAALSRDTASSSPAGPMSVPPLGHTMDPAYQGFLQAVKADPLDGGNVPTTTPETHEPAVSTE